MELIDRYVYAVLRHVPAAQKDDIEKEVRTMIDELVQEQMKSSTGQEPDVTVVKAVLSSLGEPAELARQYHATPNYIIGPVLYDTYWLVVRIVLAATGIGILIAQTIQLISSDQAQIWTAFGGLISSLYQGLLSAFAVVTLIFLLIERYGLDDIKKEIKQEKEKWRPEDLPQVPGEKIRIKRCDPIATIIFSLIFLAILNVSPELFGFFEQTDNGLNMTGFLGEGFTSLLIWINMVIIFDIALEAFKIVYGRWTWPILLSCMVQNALSLVVGLSLVRHPDFINPAFIETVNSFLERNDIAVTVIWQSPLVTGLTVIIAFGFAVEMITLATKCFHLQKARRAAV